MTIFYTVASLSDCNGTRTHNHLVHKQTLNHLTKLAKWLSCVVSTFLYSAFDCMLLSCHVPVPGSIHTLYLPESQGTPCSKQAWNLKFKWLQLDSMSVHWVFVYEISGCGFEYCCSHLNFKCDHTSHINKIRDTAIELGWIDSYQDLEFHPKQ